MRVPGRLVDACQRTAEGAAWLQGLPETIRQVRDRWCLSLGEPFDGAGVSCAWVAPAVRRDGSRSVLKVGMPHMEGAHELEGLRFWNGGPAVRLLESDAEFNAMLLESCEPGSPLRERPDLEQDAVITTLLHRLWRTPAAPHPFRPLSAMTAHWARDTRSFASQWPDPGLVQEGLGLLADLSRSTADDVLLATDLHAGNVLRAEREPWLVIDPKPFVGDRAYDATQHLFNCPERLLADPAGTIHRFADRLEIDGERLRLWMFARSAAEPRDAWDDASLTLARALA